MKKITLLLVAFFSFVIVSCKNERDIVSDTAVADQEEIDSSPRVFEGMHLPNAGEAIPGTVIIKVSQEAYDSINQGTVTGRMQLNNAPKPMVKALNNIRATQIERVFPYAGKYEKRTVREGLHLFLRVTFDKQVSVPKAMQSLFKVEGVETVEYEPELVPLSVTSRKDYWMFNDPYLPRQYHYNNLGVDRNRTRGAVEGADINLIKAWEIETGKPEVIVCVVDGAIDVRHPDLIPNMWINEAEMNGIPGVDDDNNGKIDDIHGWNFANNSNEYIPDSDFHGSHVAGTIAAKNNNGIGVAGIAGGDGTPNSGVRLMTSAIFSVRDGKDSQGGGAAAIKYGADNGAVISQNSWGSRFPGPTPSSTRKAIDYFIKYAGCDNDGNQLPNSPMKGGIVIFAAGNDNSEQRYSPGEYEPAFTVCAMGPGFERASYSNYGTWTDITAPGGDQERYGMTSGVLSTFGVDQSYAFPDEKGYAWYQGTSMACPHVSGVAALVVSHRGGPGFTAAQLEQCLLAGTNDIEMYNPGYEGKLGAGYIDAYLALTLENKNKAPEAPKFLPEKSKENDFLSATIYWQVPKDADDGAPSKYELYISDKPLDKSNYTKGRRLGNESGYVSGMNKEAGEEMSFKVSDLKHSTTYYLAIVAIDRWGLKSAPAFMETKTKVNNPPVITNVPKEPITVFDIKGSAEYTLMVNEPDGQKWKIASEGETTGVTLAKTDEGIKVRIRPVLAQGDYSFTVVVTDELGTSASFEIPFRVINVKAPELIEKLPNTLVGVENDPLTLDISKVFKPQELLEFSYKVSSSNGSVATAVVEGSKLTIKAFQPGKTTITITVSNGYYETRTSFEVSVTKNLDNEVYAVWPLPMKEKLNLWVNPKSSKPVITIYTMTGEKVMDKALLVDHEGMSSVKVKNLAPGTYRIRVTGTGKKPFEQVVQKR
nr:S8 family serine peptidase [uncultured Porphyromonas sp.]